MKTSRKFSENTVVDSKIVNNQKYISLAHFYDNPFTLRMSKVFGEWHLKTYGEPGIFYMSTDAQNYFVQCGEAIVFEGSFEEAFVYFLEVSQ
jgi:hypothetical protein